MEDLDDWRSLLALLFPWVMSAFFYACNIRLQRQLEAARKKEEDALDQVFSVAKSNSKDVEELSLVRKELQTTAGERNNLRVEVESSKSQSAKEREELSLVREELQTIAEERNKLQAEVQESKAFVGKAQMELGNGETGVRFVDELEQFLADLPSLTEKQLQEQDHMAYTHAVQNFCPCVKPRCIAAFTVLGAKMAELAISNHGLQLMTTHLDRIESLLELNQQQTVTIETQQQAIRERKDADGLMKGKMLLLRDEVVQLEAHLRLPSRTPGQLPAPDNVWGLFNTELVHLTAINNTISDPRSNQHLRLKALRWEHEAKECTRLRTLNAPLSATNNIDDLRATINRLRPQADSAATLTQSLTTAQNTISNMTNQVQNLKRQASGSETTKVTKLRSEVSTLNNKIREQHSTIAAQRTQLNNLSDHTTTHAKVEIKPFGLAGTQSFELEAVRLLKWIQSTNKEAMKRAERMNVRTGLGWDAYAALEALMKQVVEDLEEGVRKVLALKG